MVIFTFERFYKNVTLTPSITIPTKPFHFPVLGSFFPYLLSSGLTISKSTSISLSRSIMNPSLVPSSCAIMYGALYKIKSYMNFAFIFKNRSEKMRNIEKLELGPLWFFFSNCCCQNFAGKNVKIPAFLKSWFSRD